MPHYP
ncbi:uncharacterized protein FFFS_15818 [Fusarium fujikuroi]